MPYQEDVNFRVANETRKFEIELFWKRALFFGGFVSITFVGYYTVSDLIVKLMLAVFGAFCSYLWILVNKGSKFWQENWEGHIAHSDVEVKKEMFQKVYRKNSKELFGANKFSPSKITIALTSYITVLWVFLVLKTFFFFFYETTRLIGLCLIFGTLCFSIFTYYNVHSKGKWKRSRGNEEWLVNKED